MTRPRMLSTQAVAVIHALAADPSRYRYGYDLVGEVGLKSGSLYPILMRLADRGLLEAVWENDVPGRPPRHMYRLTPAGLELSQRLQRVLPAADKSVSRPRLREA